MSEIRERTIISVVNELESKIYLPAIQREFVWKPEQIETLFDSLLKDYPIGTLLFWNIPEENEKDFLLYKFFNEYDEDVSFNIQLAEPKSNPHDTTAVLDGQQRLAAFYIGMKGSYSYKRQGERKKKKRYLYLNLLYPHYKKNNSDDDSPAEEITKGGFRFLTPEEAEKQNGCACCWFKVNDIVHQSAEDNDFYPIVQSIIDHTSSELRTEYEIQSKRSLMIYNLTQTHARLMSLKLLSIHEITNKKSLDEIADIFVRVNSGGTKLVKTDLLFSLVAASWKNSRGEFKDLRDELKDKYFEKLDNDFIMRCCLAISLKDPSIKANQLNHKNIQKIESDWAAIKAAIIKCADMLNSWGFQSDTISGTNAVIPIVFFIYTANQNTHSAQISSRVSEELRKCFVSIMLTARFTQGTDKEVPRLINAMNSALNHNRPDDFSFQKFCSAYDENDTGKAKSKSFEITKETIDDLLKTPKGSPKAFILLSILEPEYNLGYQLHVDHMHPKAAFTKSKLNEIGIPENVQEEWREKREQLPNLQLLNGHENQSKKAKPFSQWVAEMEDKDGYISDNGLTGCSLEIKDFDAFFEKRKAFLRKKLEEYFEVSLIKI